MYLFRRTIRRNGIHTHTHTKFHKYTYICDAADSFQTERERIDIEFHMICHNITNFENVSTMSVHVQFSSMTHQHHIYVTCPCKITVLEFSPLCLSTTERFCSSCCYFSSLLFPPWLWFVLFFLRPKRRARINLVEIRQKQVLLFSQGKMTKQNEAE